MQQDYELCYKGDLGSVNFSAEESVSTGNVDAISTNVLREI